ncbi:MAG: matrixin family metalloprotease [Planctomycetes bacterium]|nr:matrixin family metalloprotease [Planctomycetota bacterium]
MTPVWHPPVRQSPWNYPAFLSPNTIRVTLCGCWLLIVLILSAQSVDAAAPGSLAPVVILANRSPEVVEFTVAGTGGEPIVRKLAPLDFVALPVTGTVPLEFQSGAETRRYGLTPPGIYCFAIAGGERVDLTRIDLRAMDAPRQADRSQPGAVDRDKLSELSTIPIKIYVDDNEVTRREVWEPRLRKRIEAANEILKTSAGVQLKVIDADIWQSDNKVTDFELTLKEFERAVRPAPAALAIGFTSQYPVRLGRQKLGATRAPLHPYILLREYGPRISERERVEVLVHELGHYLGAAHSPEPDSVMRPTLGDDQVNLRRFRILFDPVNALAINLIAQQWRDRKVRALYQIDSPTRSALADVYRVLAEADPKDPAAAQYLRLLSETDFSTAARGAAVVVEGIAAADSKPPGATPLETSDQRANRYIRTAAAVAMRLPSESMVDSFLLGLAVGLGEPSAALHVQAGNQQSPVLAGRPTAHGQEIVLKRFVTAAALARMGGDSATEAAILARQVHQLRTGGHFSFAELTAELAGIRFASALGNGKMSLPMVVQRFSVDHFLPTLPEGFSSLSAADFAERYGSIYDPRFQSELERLRRELTNLPAYRG